jgi:hypothetical protein
VKLPSTSYIFSSYHTLDGKKFSTANLHSCHLISGLACNAAFT